MPPKGKYTDPKLRDQVKEEVQNSDKGGAPGQWSARKAQFMAQEYKKRGGDYTTDKKTGQDESQKNLSKWSEEEWQTKDGSGNAKKSDGTQQRYLPKKAWEQMDEKEKKETDDKKQAASKEGQQHVGNTNKAKSARENANKEENENFEGKKQKQAANKKSNGRQANGDAPRRSARGAKTPSEPSGEQAGKQSAKEKKDEDKEMKDKDDEEFEDPGTDEETAKEQPDGKEESAGETKTAAAEKDEAKQEEPEVKAGNKRGRGTKKQEEDSKSNGNKKQKSNSGEGKPKGTIGSKHDSAEEPAPAASKDRLPKKGQQASWKALPGWVHGEVVEIVTESKTVDGKSVKGSKDDPRIVLKSDNGKIAVHKATAVHFED